MDLFAMAFEIQRAYGSYLRDHVSVDFVRSGPAPYDMPLIGFDEDGHAYLELESLDWHTRERVSLAVTEVELAAKGTTLNGERIEAVMSGGVLGQRIEAAVLQLQAPPPLWVDP